MIWDNINTTGEDISTLGATAEACLAMGMKYCIGHGVAQNNIAAHKWFNIASIKGSDKAKSYRLELSQEMTATEIAEAQRQARQFLTLH
jgi:TPR repeat protein